MKLNELQVYKLSNELANNIWNKVARWNSFQRDTIGTQLIRAVDSISANISKGYGRFHFNENKHFLYYARGSLFETHTWITKAYNRKLIKEEDYNKFLADIKNLGIKLNNYIKSVGTKKQSNDN